MREIDGASTGFVTKTELDDILKVLYEDELGNRDLGDLLQPYCSVTNKILVNYRSFKEFLISKLKGQDSASKDRKVDGASRNNT